ncbi:hypothetical protein tloyanaT_15750 [Thalassotalea loyana]|uniref:SMODS and SLOG-associating 2TM effector domain-containing protein n=1 Tax=Thalassotalea loyana TaxID=280483 RepID=A0ABQ6HB28_9GAMM|nr:hypothetical protein [Thalassotalea loyana]GLX85323.1 hypothetical protein tloyanaT_15750 [Thalassotalea loyana]
MSHQENKSYIMNAVAWQDTLLQSYRSLHITIQSILLAISVALAVTALSLNEFPSFTLVSGICVVIHLTILVLQRYSTSKFSGVVTARGNDINWWHKELLKVEHNSPPDERFFTKFKVHQQARRHNFLHLEQLFLQSSGDLTENDIDTLIGKGIGHTRRVIDQQLFKWVSWICLVLFTVTCIGPVYGLVKMFI